MTLWRAWAKKQVFTSKAGAKYVPNAIQAYNSLADRWIAANGGVGTPPSAPPTASYPVPDVQITAQCQPNKVVFTGSASTDASTVVECWLQRLEKATRLPAKDGYRVVGYAALTEAGKNEFTVTVAPGPYAAQYRFINKLTGQATPLMTIPVSGVALSLEDGGADEVRKAA